MSRLSTIGRGVVVALWMTACDAPALPDAATGDDAGGVCGSDARCDDGLFCTGIERCDPAHPSADARGCVVVPACAATEACDEDARACVPRDGGGADGGECDADGDGHESIACGGDDCDDADAQRFPGNVERCEGTLAGGLAAADHDEDCDPCTVAGALPDGDRDDDRFVSASCSNPWLDAEPIGCNLNQVRVQVEERRVVGADCDDDPATGANVRPNQVEVCGNLVDDNCDGAVDEGRFYRDLDNDGRGDPAVEMTGSCMPGWVTNADDCDDTRSETYLGARELCDGLDNDCSLPGAAAGGPDPSEDMDGDGHSPLSATCLGRGEPGAPGFAFPKDDCDDSDATIYTGADEICGNGIDEDCDRIPDNPTQRICTDADGDDHGSPATLRTIDSCEVPAGHVPEARCDDCNDAQPSAFPGNREICDRLDNDCSSGGGVDASEDIDGDGYAPIGAMCAGLGEAGVPATAFPRTDCDDSVATTHPGATEVCDRVDADCSSGGGVALDEDFDDDGHAPVGGACLGRGESGAPVTALVEDDCDDMNASVHGGRTPLDDYSSCDGVDQDCDPSTSELTHTEGCMALGYCGPAGTCGRGLPVVQLTAGSGFACARRAEGSVLCWGRNDSGQLGDGTTSDRIRPGLPALEASVVAVDAGYGHACAVLSDGDVRCWGANGGGQLGDGSLTPRSTPVPVALSEGAVQIGGGHNHTCARMSGGTVQCWGSNSNGELGDGTTLARLLPGAVRDLSDAVDLCVGRNHACVVRSDGAVRCWGDNISGQLGDGTRVDRSAPVPVSGITSAVAVTCGGGHTCARLDDGSVRCWGNNSSGQLGVGSPTTPSMALTPIDPGIAGVASIDAGGTHTCAVYADGSARCWGSNGEGQIGDGTTTQRPSPTAVAIPSGNVVEIAAGDRHTCARTDDGGKYCWGDNEHGSVGSGSLTDPIPTPAALQGLNEVDGGLAAGDRHTCARIADETLRCWGGNAHGQIDGSGAPHLLPVRVEVSDVRAVAVGASHTCVLIALRGFVPPRTRVACWGQNDEGQLGDGTTTSRSTPAIVPGLDDVTQVTAGASVTCAVLTDDTVRCWGAGGQVGDGTTTRRLSPTLVPGLTGVREVSAGTAHVCAIAGGRVLCWGRNDDGQLGDGTTTARTAPVTVVDVRGNALDLATRVAAGHRHTCALGSSRPYCWGHNSTGQLGDGTTTGRHSATRVSGTMTFRAIAAGGLHTCGVLTSGSMACWGSNASGQIGDPSVGTTALTPVPVPGVTDVVLLEAGNAHTCIVDGDSAVRCWGMNNNGQIGDGTATDRSSPTLVWAL